MVSIIHQPHDKFFRTSMTDFRVASEFFKAHLPDKILNQVDLSTLALQKSTFIDEAYQACEADLLYLVIIGNAKAYLYILCEHQSKVDNDMAFRMLTYIVRAMELHRKQNPGDSLPIVYPVVVYTGEKPWDAPLDIFELYGTNKVLAREIMFQPYQLIDVDRLDDQQLQQRQWSGLVEFALKYRNARNVNNFFDILLPWLRNIEHQQGEDYCTAVLKYTLDGIQIDDERLFVQKVQQHLSGKLRGEAMTLAQRFEQKGREQGIEQGREIGLKQGCEEERLIIARRLLEKGVEADLVANVTKLSLSQVEEL
jgi:predicted transposase/invertase (TIGR01784 family)